MPFQIFVNLDRQILILVNSLPHNYIIENFFLFFSVAGNFGLLWLLITFALVLFDGLDNRKELCAIVLTVVLDILWVESILKNLFMRLRPEISLTGDIITVLDPTNSYSFPSGHATIAFAAAYILSQQRKRYAYLFYLLAFFVALSRIYLGKHYPSDVIAGAAFGLIIGKISFWISGKFFPVFLKKGKHMR